MKLGDVRSSTTLLPIGVAVLATAVFGWWSKNQPDYRRQYRRLGVPISDYPRVTLQATRSGTGAPPDRSFRNYQEAGAWIWFDVFDNNERREVQDRRVLAVTFTVTDDEGKIWSTESQFFRGGLLLTVPAGYGAIPKNLIVEARAAGRLLGTWKMPELLPPLRRLSQRDWAESSLFTAADADPSIPRSLKLELSKSLPANERWEIELIGHSFKGFTPPLEAVLQPGSRFVWLHNALPQPSDQIEEIELSVRKSRSYQLRNRVELAQSYVRRVAGQPMLYPKPSRVQLDESMWVDIKGVFHEGSADRPNRSVFVSISPSGPVQSLSARVVELAEHQRGLRVELLNGAGRETASDLPTRPGGESPQVGQPILDGPFPITLIIDSQPFRVYEEQRLVLPIRRSSAKQ